MPAEKPRHLLGVGEIDDIFDVIERGTDTFDCVQPTRLARMGRLFLKTERNDFILDITKNQYELDTTPPDPDCACYTCTHYSRAYLHHLFRVRELLAYRLSTIHNIYFVNSLVKTIRTSIANGTFLDLKKAWLYNR